MKYLRVAWKHNYPDEPVMFYSEIDNERWEVRKVVEHRDGRLTYASETEKFGTDLGENAVPELAEIAKEAEFEPIEITKEEFEAMWTQRKRSQ